MSAVQQLARAIRPEVMVRDRFEVFAINSGPISGQGIPLPVGDATTLPEAVSLGCTATTHKGRFLVRHTDKLTGRVLHHFYGVKRKSVPNYRFHDHQTRAVHDLYAEELLVVDVTALEALS